MAHSVEQHLTLEARLDKGAKNLLVDCADVRAGQEVLIVTEDEPDGYYDTRAPAHVARVATEMGARVHAMRVPSIGGPESLPSVLAAAVAAADHTIFDIDPDVIQSWHAGIHPQTYYSRPPAGNLWRWANLTFSSPRRVHFHTCGGPTPGEISWSVFDASIKVDSDRLWCDGRFEFLERDDIRTRLRKYPDAAPLYEMRTDIGV